MQYDALIPLIFLCLCLVCGGTFVVAVRRERAVIPVRRLCWLILGNAALVLALTFLAAFAAELYYRYWYDRSDSFTLTRTGEDWFKRHYRYNNWQVRDSVEYANDPMPGKRRITFLGDSFTAGHGIADVEKRFANRIRADRPDWEVHVLGFNGYDSVDELEMLRRAPAEYRFDIVVLVYCLNDISKITPNWNEQIGSLYYGSSAWIVQKSYILNTLFYRWKRAHQLEVQNFYSFTHSTYADEGLWSKQQVILNWIKNEIEDRGGKLVVVTFPFLHSLGERYEFRIVHDRLRDFWRRLAVPHLDLIDVLEKHAAEGLTVNRYDAHPNERAHEIAAEAIMKFLDEHIES